MYMYSYIYAYSQIYLGKARGRGEKSANFVPPPNHKFKKPSYAELKEKKLVLVKGIYIYMYICIYI